jgi:hypothetical protein
MPPPPIQFFNFGTDETYHFFKWITESGLVSTEQLIRDAYADAEKATEGSQDRDIEEALGLCVLVQEKLAGLLWLVVEKQTPLYCRMVSDPPDIGRVGNDLASLLQPILHLGLLRIDYAAVAEVLLICAGKWAPNNVRPEAR